MIVLKIKLSFGETGLTEQDIRDLKPEIDKAFLNLNQDEYTKLKNSTKTVIEETFENMTDEELLKFAKVNDLHKREHYIVDSFTQKIYAELFKRIGLGHKQLRTLSFKQRKYLKSLGLRDR
jgi:hypothetical protein